MQADLDEDSIVCCVGQEIQDPTRHLGVQKAAGKGLLRISEVKSQCSNFEKTTALGLFLKIGETFA